MITRWTFCAILLASISLSSFGATAMADIWSPSTWFSQPGGKKSSVSVAKAHKKASTSQNLTGRRPSNSSTPGLATTSHDFLEKTRTIMAPAKPKKPVTATKKAAAKNDKPSVLKSMFRPEPPPPPQTVKEWLALKRPN